MWTGYHYFHNFPTLLCCTFIKRRNQMEKFSLLHVSRDETNFFCWMELKDKLPLHRVSWVWSIFLLSPFEIAINKSLFLGKLNLLCVIWDDFASFLAIFHNLDRYSSLIFPFSEYNCMDFVFSSYRTRGRLIGVSDLQASMSLSFWGRVWVIG